MFPNRVPVDTFLSPEAVVYSLIHIHQWSLPTKMGKTFVHCPWISMGTEGLHTMGCGMVSKLDRLQHCNLYPSAMQPSA